MRKSQKIFEDTNISDLELKRKSTNKSYIKETESLNI